MISLFDKIKHKKHIIWDWNGTLLNDLEHVVRALSKLSDKYEFPSISLEKYLAEFKFPISKFYKDVGIDLNKIKFTEISKSFHEAYNHNLHTVGLFEGAKDLLEQVRTLTGKQSVLTAAYQGHIEDMLEKHNLKSMFDHVFGLPDGFANGKIERGHSLMLEAGVSQEETILIGDTDHDLEVGKDLGIDVILVSKGHQCVTRLEKIHHTIHVR